MKNYGLKSEACTELNWIAQRLFPPSEKKIRAGTKWPQNKNARLKFESGPCGDLPQVLLLHAGSSRVDRIHVRSEILAIGPLALVGA